MSVSGTMTEGELRKLKEEEEEKKKVSCIVKFRPCEDWRGEYGFDWVREGPEDYEERIDCRDVPFTDDQNKQIIRKHMGEEKYRIWRRKHALAILEANSDEEMKKARADYQSSLEDYYNKLNEREVNENFDADAWKTKKDDTFSEEESEKDQGCTPMEYAYPAKYVTRVVYEMDRKKFGNVWFTSCLEYNDMANGSDEIEDSNAPAEQLDYLVNVDGHIQSLKKNSFYSFPCYSDGKSSNQVPSCFDRRKLTDKWHFLPKGKNIYKYKKISTVVFDEFLYGDNDSINAYQFRITTKVIRFVKFADTDRAMAYVFKYIMLKGKMHVMASVDCVYEGAPRRCRCHYIDGELSKIFCGGKWRLLEKAKNDRKFKEEALLLERMSAEVFVNRMIQNDHADIEYICLQNEEGSSGQVEDGVLDHVQMVLSNPGFLEMRVLMPVDGIHQKDGKDFWGDYEINSWGTRYKETFRSLDLILTDGDKKKEIDYSIPVLSFGVSELPRKRFTFRTLKEAPKKELEKTHEFKLQLRIEGDCPKLRFDTNNPSSVVVDPKEITNPKDHDEITIKFIGKRPCWPSVMALCVDEDENEKRVGQLDLHIEEKRRIPIGLVNALIDNKPLSSKFVDAVEDNLDLMTNALLHAGIEPEIIRSSINIKSSQIRGVMSGKDIRFDKSDALDRLLVKELNKQREKNVKLRFSYLIFCIDKGITDNVAGYSSSIGMILISNCSAYLRADISTIMHELLHALMHPHHFQLNLNNSAESNPFCFPIKTSSNIMDYYTLNYSLHQYQWWLMQYALDDYIVEMEKKIEAEKLRLIEKIKQERKKKRHLI